MVSERDVTTLHVVQLDNGRFAAVLDGQLAADWSGEEFDTQEEAEASLFERTQKAGIGNDLGILTPGGGQGVR